MELLRGGRPRKKIELDNLAFAEMSNSSYNKAMKVALTRRKRLANRLNTQISHLEALYDTTKPETWGSDEEKFKAYRDAAKSLLRKIYKGNVVKKAEEFDDAIEGGGGVVYTRRPDGSRDPRNHATVFKREIAAAIKALKNYRLELESIPLRRLRWTKKQWLIGLGSLIGTIIIILAKELPSIIKAFRSK